MSNTEDLARYMRVSSLCEKAISMCHGLSYNNAKEAPVKFLLRELAGELDHRNIKLVRAGFMRYYWRSANSRRKRATLLEVVVHKMTGMLPTSTRC